MNSIFTRRTVRSFTDTYVENDVIEHILRAGMQAPSSYNQQPWEFLVVRNKDKLSQLAQSKEYAGALANFNLLIVVVGNVNRMRSTQWADLDLATCSQNILLQVAELGLGAVWVGTYPIDERIERVQQVFNLDKHILPFSLIGIGYPKNENANVYVDRYDPSRISYID